MVSLPSIPLDDAPSSPPKRDNQIHLQTSPDVPGGGAIESLLAALGLLD